MPTPAARRAQVEGNRPDRAVIDIGSNTVRMVVYRGSQRAPEIWLNERVSARLGRDLVASGQMPEKSMDEALAALARYATILRDLGIDDVQTVATAAVRDAANGPAFLERVRAAGLSPQLLTGEQEAMGSAFGVIGAFPGALGTVADLGGGSLELVMIEGGDCHDGCSLPLGTLRLPALRHKGPAAFRKAVEREMARAGWAAAHPGPLYMVGGTWRALAAYALRSSDHPLTDPHAFAMEVGEVDRIARKVARLDPAVLAPIPGISSLRAGGLPDAAAMLRIMLAALEPEGVVFSSWGLREGLLFQRLSPEARRQDPLLAGVTQFAAPRGGSATAAALIAGWTATVGRGDGNGSERLRLAATILAMASAHVEPNWRARHAYEWAMDKRWPGIDPEGRARIAAALLAACGKIAPPPALERLASWQALSQAVSWGLAIRLCRRLGAGSRQSLENSALTRDGDRLILWIAPSHAQLATDPVTGDLKALAQWLGLAPEVRVSANAGPIQA
jgi:exopolyphosphatase/guanosine-5'-triphosphate,3'-diphosphate pyrophosphatase